MIYKVLDDDGSGKDSWIIKALDHIFETNEQRRPARDPRREPESRRRVRLEAFDCGHTPLCVELRRLWRQGVVVVLAAGNEGFATLSTSDGDALQANMDMSIGDPANLEEAIAVGSVHKDEPHTYGISFFSSRGPTADGRRSPTASRPGEQIFSVRSDAPVEPNGAPHVRAALHGDERHEHGGAARVGPHRGVPVEAEGVHRAARTG